MEVVIPLSTFLKVQNKISSPRHDFPHFSIFGQKSRHFEEFFDQKLKNVEIHVLDLKLYSALLGKSKEVLQLPFPII